MKFVCFGEIMLRLNPHGNLRLTQANNFEVSFGGGEANVAVSLCNFGMNASFVTKLPKNPLGEAVIKNLKSFGVGVSDIVYGGERLGIYFIEKGASQRPSKVIYDRKYSSISTALKDDFDWDKIFYGAKWFHFTGITPALSDNVTSICLEALKIAKEKNITVSCDLNYRKNLWSPEKAGQVMTDFMPYIDVLIANEEDAEKVFSIKADSSNIEEGEISKDGYIKVAKTLSDRFNINTVAITLRESISASINNWAGLLYCNNQTYLSNTYKINIVDRVGGGDSFAAGLIYALSENFSIQDAINFAVAASCLKHTVEFDFNHVSVDEVKELVKGNGSGRVIR